MAWRTVLTDLDYRELGALDSDQRQFEFTHNATPKFSGVVPFRGLVAPRILDGGYIKVYNDTKLMGFGPLITAELVADSRGASVSWQAAGVGWLLTKRLAGMSASGTTFADVDRATIMPALLEQTNIDNETGIMSGVSSSSAVGTYVVGPYKPLSDINTELSTDTAGYDWRIDPIEPTTVYRNSAKIGVWRAADSIGAVRRGAIFSFGAGTQANTSSFNYKWDRTTQINQAYHYTDKGPDYPDFPTVSYRDDEAAGKWRLMQEVIQADLLDEDMRRALVYEHTQVRKAPRQTITFQPLPWVRGMRVPVPRFGYDYDVGDFVIGRGVVDGQAIFNAVFRVWGASVSVDARGQENVTLTLEENPTT